MKQQVRETGDPMALLLTLQPEAVFVTLLRIRLL